MNRIPRTRGSCLGAKRVFQSTKNSTEESQVSKRQQQSTGLDTQVFTRREQSTGSHPQVFTRREQSSESDTQVSTRREHSTGSHTQVFTRREQSSRSDTQVSKRREQNTDNVNGQEFNNRLDETYESIDEEDFETNLHTDDDLTVEENDSTVSTRGANRIATFWKEPSQREEIHINGTSFEEASVPRTITSIVRGNIRGPWTTWGMVPKNIKKELFETFKGVYKWTGHNDDEVYYVWNVVSENGYKQMFSQARRSAKLKSNSNNPKDWKNYKPIWLTNVFWRGCIRVWSQSKWQQMSENNSKNRVSKERGGPLKHRGGSVSFAVHMARWKEEHGGNDPTPYEFFDKLHKVEDGVYIDQKAQETHEKYIASMEENYGPDLENHPNFDLGAWNAATKGPKKGRMYGLGSSQLALEMVNASRPSKGRAKSNGDVEAMQQRIEELERENAEAKGKVREMEEIERENKERMEKLEQNVNQLNQLRALMLGDRVSFSTLLSLNGLNGE